MSVRYTIVLLAVALSLVLFFLIFESGRDTTDEAFPFGQRIFAKDITRITIDCEGKRTVCERDDDEKWWVIEPVRYPADMRAIDRMTIGLEFAMVRMETDIGEAEAGLDSPRARCEFEAAGKRYSFCIGREAAYGNEVYVRITGRKKIVLLEASFAEAFLSAEMRDRKVMDFRPVDVTELAVESGGQTILLKYEDELWRMHSPLACKADGTNVSFYLSDLYDFQVERFVKDDETDFAKYGADSPYVKISIKEKESDKSRVLIIGNMLSDGEGMRYAFREGEPYVFAVKDETVQNMIRKDVTFFRSKRPFEFDTASVVRVEIRAGERLTLVERKPGEGWRFMEPAGVADILDEEHLCNFLERLRFLDVEDFIAEDVSDFSSYGLDQPVASVLVKTQTDTGSKEQVLEFGEVVAGGEGRYGRMRGTSTVFTLKELCYEELKNKGYLLFRMETLLDTLPENVVELELEKGVIKLGFKPAEDGTWRMYTPIEQPDVPYDLKSFVNRVCTMNVVEYIGYDIADEPQWGFSLPGITISIIEERETFPRVEASERDKEKLRHTIIVGMRSDEGFFAKWVEKKVVFVMPQRIQKILVSRFVEIEEMLRRKGLIE